MTVRESVECAERLRESFRDVVVLADRAEPVVRARQHFRGPARLSFCTHDQKRTARNVTAALRTTSDGTFASGDGSRGRGLQQFSTLCTCCRCDAVTSFEIAA